jgi:hypothetical protein
MTNCSARHCYTVNRAVTLQIATRPSILAAMAACLLFSGCAISPPLAGREILVDGPPEVVPDGPEGACVPPKLGHFARFRSACRKHLSIVHITWDPVDQPPAPHPRFHPVPTRPVFAPQSAPIPLAPPSAAPANGEHAAPVEPAVEPAIPAHAPANSPAAPDKSAATKPTVETPDAAKTDAAKSDAGQPSATKPALPISSTPAAPPSKLRLAEPNALPAVDDPTPARELAPPPVADAPSNVWMPRRTTMRR